MNDQLTCDAIDKISSILDNIMDLSGKYFRIIESEEGLLAMSGELEVSFNDLVSSFNRNFIYNNEDIFTVIRFIQSAELDIQICDKTLIKLIIPADDRNFLTEKDYQELLTKFLAPSNINMARFELMELLGPVIDKRLIDKLSMSGAVAC